MKISAKTEYACIAILELAAHFETGEPVRVGKIAEENGIPLRFLVQILLQLKGAGLVTSIRGASGGYRMIVPPADVSLRRVMEVIEGHPPLTTGEKGASPGAVVLFDVWQKIADAERSMLEATSVAELVDRMKRCREPMYYI
ncbi:MAG: Rrf2 family transcriptional regulator [Pirellulales bacterium]